MSETPRFNGMNGTIMVNTRREGIPIGQVSGEPYGYRNRLRATVEFRIERAERQVAYETTAHDMVETPLSFSITTAVWNPPRTDWVTGGATVAPLRELVTYARGFDPETAERLASLDEWHLNTLTAACDHMDIATLAREDNGYGGTSISTRDPRNVCPVTGYRYGHKWLVRVLPDMFLPDLFDLLSGIDQSMLYSHPDTGRDLFAARGYDVSGKAVR